MASLSVTLSANAGVSLEFGDHRVFVDALHTCKVPGFSTVDKLLQGRMLCCTAFQHPELIVYTHCHPDHYSKELTAAAMRLYPAAKLLVPEMPFAKQLWQFGDLELEFLRLPHEGVQYAEVIHYGILFTWKDKHILIPGDCETASPILADAVQDIPVDVAILNFPWLTLKKGREFVNTVLRPKHEIVYHLPFADDDTNGFCQSAHAARTENVFILDKPLQAVTIEL